MEHTTSITQLICEVDTQKISCNRGLELQQCKVEIKSIDFSPSSIFLFQEKTLNIFFFLMEELLYLMHKITFISTIPLFYHL